MPIGIYLRKGKIHWTPEMVEKVRHLYWDEQKSPMEIVAILSLPIKPCSIWGIFHRRNIPIRTYSEAIKLAERNIPRTYTLSTGVRKHVKWDNDLIARCKHLYVDEGINATDISKIIGLKPHAIVAALKRHGVPLRTHSQSQIIAHKMHPESYCREVAPNWKGGRRENRNKGYVEILLEPSDPYYCMAQRSGYVAEHRYIVAKHLGRPLECWEVVHHKNRNKKDNRIENLHLYPSKEHRQLHIEWKLISRIKMLEQRVTLLEVENTLLKKQVVSSIIVM